MIPIPRPEADILLRGGYVLPVSERTCVMGVINVTPDSFSDGGCFMDPGKALERARRMSDDGVDIIDIGGESSRPGAKPIGPEEEVKRVAPVIKAIKSEINIPISVDTYRSEVAEMALSEGCSIINDITAMRGDAKMPDVISRYGAAVILMHMKNDPTTMQDDPEYSDVVSEIYDFLAEAVENAVRAGIEREKIIVDPGIGFGKILQHNIDLIKGISVFRKTGRPVLIGTSRKSFLGKLTGKDQSGREFATSASVTASIMMGANIVRVHDTENMKDVVRVTDAIVDPTGRTV